MKNINIIILVSFGLMGLTANAAPWMKCISTSNIASSGGSSLISPTSQNAASTGNGIGIIFTLETNNGNYISADTFLLNGQGQKIKQVGHSEVLSANPQNTSASSAVVLQNSSDSPFPMAVTLSPVAGSTTSAPAVPAMSTTPAANAAPAPAPTKNPPQLLTGALTTEGLFNGQTLSQVYLQCRLFLPKAASQIGPTANP